MDWFEHLTTGADILPLEAAQRLLHSKQDVLEKQHKQWQRKAEAQEAAARAKARSVFLQLVLIIHYTEMNNDVCLLEHTDIL